MSKYKLFLTLIVGLIFSSPATAYSPPGNNDTLSGVSELKPVFSFEQLDKAFKTASVCFLGYGDCDPNAGFGSGDENYSIDTAKQCQNEGYSKPNCNSVQVIDGTCPYNSSYGKGCKCASNLVTCPAGQVGVGESCGGKYASCQCDPKLVSCASNQVGQGASCGGKYQSCACKSEYVYNSSNCKSPRSLSGASCGGKYTGCSCPSGVSAGTYGCKEYYGSPCSSVCKTAYTDNCHKRTDNNSAVYGCMKYWSDCSSKCETPYTDNCRNRTAVDAPYGCQTYWSDCSTKCQTAYTDNCRNKTAVSVPSNATCSSYYSDCSSKCSAWTCNSGYVKDGNGCCDNSCPDGYSFTYYEASNKYINACGNYCYKPYSFPLYASRDFVCFINSDGKVTVRETRCYCSCAGDIYGTRLVDCPSNACTDINVTPIFSSLDECREKIDTVMLTYHLIRVGSCYIQ